MLTDYQNLVFRIQKDIGENFKFEPEAFNIPGRSVACKIDPNYYLALNPGFIKKIAAWSGLLPKKARAALVFSGNILSFGPKKKHVVRVGVTTGGKVMEIAACFVLAEFLDRALTLYGGHSQGLEISELKISIDSNSDLAELFKGKTELHKMAMAQTAQNAAPQ